jgi:RNA polymerase sigma-70 factor (ECF subfamily)
VPLLAPLRDEIQARRVARACAGDGAAFRALYRELYPPVAAFIARRVRVRADAEDLVSRVFCAFVKHLGGYERGRGSVQAWILTIARNAVIDHLRARRPAVPIDHVAEALPGAGDLLGDLLARERLGQLAAQLEALPADLRELLALRFGDGLRHAEIAAMLGLSEAAVKQRVSRALRDLRARLRPAAEKGEADCVV